MNPQHKKIAEAIKDNKLLIKSWNGYYLQVKNITNKIADIYEEEDKKERTRYLRTFGKNQKESLRFNRTQFLKECGAENE